MNLAVHADGAAGPEVQLQSIELVQYVQHAETLHCSKACRCLCNFALKERETYENVIAIRDRFKSMVDPSPRPPVPAPAAAAADVPAADGAAAPHASSSSAAARVRRLQFRTDVLHSTGKRQGHRPSSEPQPRPGLRRHPPLHRPFLRTPPRLHPPPRRRPTLLSLRPPPPLPPPLPLPPPPPNPPLTSPRRSPQPQTKVCRHSQRWRAETRRTCTTSGALMLAHICRRPRSRCAGTPCSI